MNKACPSLSLIGASALVLLFGVPLPAQTPGSCPPPGWAEGLVRYTHPTAVVPTQDTAQLHAANCSFHMWSWETFVWATAIDPDTGVARFLTLPTFDDLAGTSVASHKGPGSLYLRPRDLKPEGGRPGDQIGGINQAGSQGVIIDQNGSPIYYSSHMNEEYFKFAKTYYGRANYDKAAPNLTFPLGAAVFKASWQIVPEGADASKFYTTSATVPILVPGGKGGVEIPPNPQFRKVTVALIGLHVVGVTVNHPEFLWGTFEQVSNAPDLPPGADPSGKEPVSGQGFTLYKANTAASLCNQIATLSFVDQPKQIIQPITNVFRQFAWGEESKLGIQDIDSINSESQGAMKNIKTQAVFANYKLIGTVWLPPSVPPSSLMPGDSKMNQEAVGSVSLANASLETFVQGHRNSCFMCHNTGGRQQYYPGKDINFSHMLLHPLAKEAFEKLAAEKEAAAK